MSELRALTRLGRRSVAKSPGRSALVVGIIALVVGAGVFAATFARSFDTTERERTSAQLGQAEIAVRSWEVDQRAEIAQLVDDPTGDRITDFQVNSWFPSGGWRTVSSVDLDHPLVAGILDLHRGRAPARTDEVALTTQALRDLNADLGSVVQLGPGSRLSAPMTVVGEIRHPFHRDHWEAVVVPTEMPVAGLETSFVSLIAADLVPDLAEFRRQVDDRRTNVFFEADQRFTNFDENPGLDLSEPEQRATFVSSTLLLQAAAVAATAFAVGARRRVAEFGQLAVIGASHRHIRALVVLEAVVLAVVGAALGVALALGVVIIGEPAWASLVGRWPTGIEASVSDVLGPVVVGVAAAVLAAWFPARQVSRLSPVQALAGRVPAGRYSPRLASLAVVLVAGGLVLFAIVLAADETSDALAAALAASIVAMFVGTTLAAGPLLTLAGRFSRYVPGLARLVSRDAARQPVRAGASVAALLVILAAPVIVGTIAISDERLEDERRHLDEELLFARSGVDGLGIPTQREMAMRTATDVPIVEIVASSLEAQGIVPEESAPVRGGSVSVAAADARQIGTSVNVGVLDANVARTLALDDRFLQAVDRGEVVVGNAWRELTRADALILGRSAAPFVVAERMPDGANGYPLPELWVSSQSAASLGILELDIGEVHRLDQPLSAASVTALRTSVADAILVDETDIDAYSWVASDLVVTGREPTGLTPQQVVGIVLLGSLVLGLLVALASAALSAVEIDRELATMVAIGAPPSIRRRFIGLQSGYLTAVAAVLATPIAVLIVAVIFRSQEDLEGVEANVPVLATVLVGMPVVVGAAMALLFRSGRPTVTRRLG